MVRIEEVHDAPPQQISSVKSVLVEIVQDVALPPQKKMRLDDFGSSFGQNSAALMKLLDDIASNSRYASSNLAFNDQPPQNVLRNSKFSISELIEPHPTNGHIFNVNSPNHSTSSEDQDDGNFVDNSPMMPNFIGKPSGTLNGTKDSKN